jgi:arsenate reductase
MSVPVSARRRPCETPNRCGRFRGGLRRVAVPGDGPGGDGAISGGGDVRGVLFLCVANSARSQMAEGLARALAPAGVRVWSAGSEPTRINPLALRALAEVGIDGSAQYSKAIADIPASEVDTVVTLCAEEVCPVFPGAVRRLHWPLPDPAAVAGSEAERLAAFRAVREEIASRLRTMFVEGG